MLPAILTLSLGQSRPSPDWLPVLDAPARIGHVLTIPLPANAGEPLTLSGRVFKSDRKTPVAGVVLYFHHTDRRGIYPRPTGARPSDWSYWHGALRGWLKTDEQGRYVLKTTRPAPYPGGSEPAHVHVYGLRPGSRQGFYFSDFVFAGDPLLTEEYWRRARRNGLERDGRITLRREAGGGWKGTRDLILEHQ